MERLPAQHRLQPPGGGDVPQRQHQPGHRRIRAQVADAGLGLPAGAQRPVQQPVEADPAAPPAARRPRGDLAGRRGPHGLFQRAPGHARGPEHLGRRGAGVPDPQPVVHDEHRIGAVPHERLEVALPVAPGDPGGGLDPLQRRGRGVGQDPEPAGGLGQHRCGGRDHQAVSRRRSQRQDQRLVESGEPRRQPGRQVRDGHRERGRPGLRVEGLAEGAAGRRPERPAVGPGLLDHRLVGHSGAEETAHRRGHRPVRLLRAQRRSQ